MIRNCRAMLLPLLLGGCTVIRIENASAVHTRVVAGVVRIEADPDSTELVAYSVRGFGIVPSRNGFTIGWSAEDAAMMRAPDRCRVVLFDFPEDPAAALAWRDLIAKRSDICMLGEKSHEKASD